MSRRVWLAALALALVAAGVAAFLLARQSGALVLPGAEPLVLADADPAALDTLAYRGRPVTASLNGVVDRVDDDGTVWLRVGRGAFPLAFPEDPGLRTEDRVLAVGRLRGRAGRRRLDVEAWSRVESAAR